MTTIARSVEPLIRPRASLKLQGYPAGGNGDRERSEEHTSELQSQSNLVCRLLLEKKKITHYSSVVDVDRCRLTATLALSLFCPNRCIHGDAIDSYKHFLWQLRVLLYRATD